MQENIPRMRLDYLSKKEPQGRGLVLEPDFERENRLMEERHT